MRKIFVYGLFLGLIIPSAAFSGNGSGNVSNVINAGGAYNSAVPGLVFPTGGFSLSNQKTLVASSSSTTAGNYMALGSMSAPGTTAVQYQVTAGKTLYCPGFFYNTSTAGGGDYSNFGYGTAALAAHDTATAPTGNVIYGATGAAAESWRLFGGTAAPQWYPIPISFPASSYPYFRTGANTAVASVIVVCYEQ